LIFPYFSLFLLFSLIKEILFLEVFINIINDKLYKIIIIIYYYLNINFFRKKKKKKNFLNKILIFFLKNQFYLFVFSSFSGVKINWFIGNYSFSVLLFVFYWFFISFLIIA
jgi:hypothetical protein